MLRPRAGAEPEPAPLLESSPSPAGRCPPRGCSLLLLAAEEFCCPACLPLGRPGTRLEVQRGWQRSLAKGSPVQSCPWSKKLEPQGLGRAS